MEPDELLLFLSRLLGSIIGLISASLLARLLYKQNVWNQFNKMVLYVSLTECVVFSANIILVIALYIYEIKPTSRFFLVVYSAIIIPGYMSISLSFQQSIANTYLLFYSIIMDEKKMKRCYILITIIPAFVMLSLSIEVIVNFDLKLLEKIQLYFIILQWTIIILNVILYLICVVSIREKFGNVSVPGIMALTQSESAILSLVSRLKWYPIVQVLSRVFVLWYNTFPNYLTRKATFQTPYFYSIELLCYACICITPIGYIILYMRQRKINWLSVFCMDTTINSSNSSKITKSRSKSVKSDKNKNDPLSSSAAASVSGQSQVTSTMASQSIYDSNDVNVTLSSEDTDEDLLDLIQNHGSNSTNEQQIENNLHLSL